ncbi:MULTISPECIES: APC family permease [Idiomarina]|uniref:Amino acid permease n=1 Tax=Idiomarina abyssalis TaxID=86102 RepID=A0A8I1KF84_9GAMM|nr:MULTISPECIES: amino acid permease [Idiomarina]MBJ7268021.1 amino acid permease [Idiomarina abyssalis]MBJ7273623.1 amino acid permease [Idiomarina abyssalis]MBJ7316191.1 amino acid permease [Idiomarina abyssalis]MBJ7316711.1 amino acid permease [Idiomarina abyssalis]MBL4857368.1 amino acid permease [Idiomarina sp.]
MSNKLVRETGLFGALVIGLGSIVGTGAYVSVGLSAEIAGSGLVLAILVAAATALMNGLSSAQLAVAHPVSGGTYEYGYQFLNPFSGRIAGILFVIAKSASAATAALAVAWYISLGLNVPPWIVKFIAVGLLLTFTVLVLSGVRRTNWLNALLVFVSLLGLIAFVGIGLSSSGMSGVDPVTSSSLSLFHAAALMFVAFTGYGRIATMGEEISAPRRNIPKAVIITLAVISAIYIAVGLTILHLGGIQSFEQSNFNIANLIPNHSWRWLVVTGGVIAMSGVVLNLVLGVSRVILAMGRRGDLPAKVAGLSGDSKSAPAATWITFAIMSLIALFGGIKAAWTLSAFTVLIYYGITNIAALKVSQTQRFIPKWVSILGLLSCFGLVLLAALA